MLETSKNAPETSPTTRPLRRLRRLRLRYILLALAALVLALGLWAFFTFRTVQERANSGAAHLQTAIDSLKGASGSGTFNAATFDRIKTELRAAESDFKRAGEAVGPWGLALPLVGWLPGPAYDASRLGPLLEMAQKSAQAGWVAIEGAKEALGLFEPGRTFGSDSPSKIVLAAQALADPTAQARFSQAAALLDEVARRRADLDPARLSLSQTRKAVDQLDGQLPALREAMGLARELPPLLPDVLGQNRPVSYLALIQNSDELRPTGGFISAVALITFDRGRLSVSRFQDSYAVDNPQVPIGAPPEALARYMLASNFLLRDANWWPDFPTSARQVADFYRQHQGLSVDGVIALDSQAVAGLFEALGPLDLPAYNERLTAENFEERLRHYYLPPGTALGDDWWLKRKEFIGVVLHGLLGRLDGAGARDYLKVADALGRSLATRHLQVNFSRAELEAQLTRRGLDGAQAQPNQTATGLNDYLMVAETNVGFNKVNPKIDRTMSYRVSGGSKGADLFGSLTITYTSRAGVREGTSAGECVKVAKYDSNYDSMTNGCYWNYLRVYVPSGSRLLDTSGFPADSLPQTGTENGRTVFASQVVLPPGGSLSVTLNYVLPYRLSEPGDYHLLVQKQAGLAATTPLQVEELLAGQNRQWSLALDGDRRFDFGTAAR